MIIIRTFSDNATGKQRKLLNDILTDYMKREKRSSKKKEDIGRIKDITNDPTKLKKKTNCDRSNKKIKDQIAGED